MGNTKPIGVAYSDQDLTGSTLTDVTLIDPTVTPPLVLSGATSQALLRITQTGTGDALVVEDAANPDSTPFIIDALGRIIAGASTLYNSFGTTPGFQFNGEGISNSTFAINSWRGSSGSGGTVTLNHAKSGLTGTFTTLAINDVMGAINYAGADGTAFVSGASIVGSVDAAPAGAGIMPGRLVFNTAPNSVSAPVERMRITSAGNVGIGTAAPVNRLQVNGSFGRGAPVTKTGNFTLADTENWLICNGAGSITMTFPAASAWTGREVMIKTIAAQTVVSASADVVPLAGGAAGTAILAATAGAWATLVSDGTNWVIMQA